MATYFRAPHLSLVLLLLLVGGCSSSVPVQDFRQDLQRYPEYAVILEDMKEEGSLFKDHYHRYRILTGRSTGGDSLEYDTRTTDWIKVDDETYEQYRDNLGMTVLSKTPDGEVTDTAYPPGYQYVGNERYGNWASQPGGGSFWVFYGQYALLRNLTGGFGTTTRVPRGEYNDYLNHRRRGQPYYAGGKYGTSGSVTQRANPDFYQRRQARRTSTVQAGRSRASSARSRSSGFGK